MTTGNILLNLGLEDIYVIKQKKKNNKHHSARERKITEYFIHRYDKKHNNVDKVNLSIVVL